MSDKPIKKIVLTGGGSAGHVTPNIALIPALKKAGYEIYYIGLCHQVLTVLGFLCYIFFRNIGSTGKSHLIFAFWVKIFRYNSVIKF